MRLNTITFIKWLTTVQYGNMCMHCPHTSLSYHKYQHYLDTNAMINNRCIFPLPNAAVVLQLHTCAAMRLVSV